MWWHTDLALLILLNLIMDVISECPGGARVAVKDYSDIQAVRSIGNRAWYPHLLHSSVNRNVAIVACVSFCLTFRRSARHFFFFVYARCTRVSYSYLELFFFFCPLGL